MPSDYSPGTPIYLQITHDVRQRIASGEWQPGMRIPPVRELSVELGVNPNTAQRSLSELEREGLVYTERTAGRFITKDIEQITQMRASMAEEYAGQFYQQMRKIGYSGEEIVELLRRTASSESTERPT